MAWRIRVANGRTLLIPSRCHWTDSIACHNHAGSESLRSSNRAKNYEVGPSCKMIRSSFFRVTVSRVRSVVCTLTFIWRCCMLFLWSLMSHMSGVMDSRWPFCCQQYNMCTNKVTIAKTWLLREIRYVPEHAVIGKFSFVLIMSMLSSVGNVVC